MVTREAISFILKFYDYCRSNNIYSYYSENTRPNVFETHMKKDEVDYTILIDVSPHNITTTVRYGDDRIHRTINFNRYGFDKIMNQMLEDGRYLKKEEAVNGPHTS